MNSFSNRGSGNYELKASSADIFEADTRANIDVQVYTAKKYPRDMSVVFKKIYETAARDINTAQDCFYVLKRDGKTISGASVRFAEIIANSYGNLRATARIIDNDGKMVTAQGMCWDLENNVAVSIEVKRKITNKDGVLFSEDMQIVTANAACSIALRNAILKVVPLALTSEVQENIKKIIRGEEKDFVSLRKAAINHFISMDVPEKYILTLFNKNKIEDLSLDDVIELRGIAVSIKENLTTVEQAFSMPNKKNGMGNLYKSLNQQNETPFLNPNFEPVIEQSETNLIQENTEEPVKTIESTDLVEKKDDKNHHSLSKVYDIEFANGKKVYTENIDSEIFNSLEEKYSSAIVKIDGIHPSEFGLKKEANTESKTLFEDEDFNLDKPKRGRKPKNKNIDESGNN
jgi:hypothetical protein